MIAYKSGADKRNVRRRHRGSQIALKSAGIGDNVRELNGNFLRRANSSPRGDLVRLARPNSTISDVAPRDTLGVLITSHKSKCTPSKPSM